MRWRLLIGVMVGLTLTMATPTLQYDDVVMAKANVFGEEYNRWAEIKRNTSTLVKRGKVEKETFERMKGKFAELVAAVESME